MWKPESQGENTQVPVGSQAVHRVPGGKSVKEKEKVLSIFLKEHRGQANLWFKKRRCRWRTMAERMPLPRAQRPAWMFPYRKLTIKQMRKKQALSSIVNPFVIGLSLQRSWRTWRQRRRWCPWQRQAPPIRSSCSSRVMSGTRALCFWNATG